MAEVCCFGTIDTDCECASVPAESTYANWREVGLRSAVGEVVCRRPRDEELLSHVGAHS